MKNNKGFTLIELLAVIIILGVLILISIPSITKYINNSRINTYATNAKKYIDSVMVEVNNQSEGYIIRVNSCLNVKISDIELESGSNLKSPFGEYKDNYSYITVFNVNGTYLYFLTLVDSIGHGWVYQEYNSIDNNSFIKSVPLNAIVPFDINVGCTASLLYGDVNGDGVVDNADITYLNSNNTDNFDIVQQVIADVNLDGKIDDEDIIIIEKHINGESGFEILPIVDTAVIDYDDVSIEYSN